MKRWNPPRDLNKKEQLIIKRLKRTRKLFAFLRLQRHKLFDEAFQVEMEQMYRQTGAGEEPVPPALLCMALIVQGYLGISDAEAVELTVMDLRWQMVLGCLGAEEPAFAQGTLQAFRERLIAHDMDRRVLERTIELARETKEFDWKKLPRDLRVAVDSRPLQGAGRVEDTFNLLGHAARKIVESAAALTKRTKEEVCRAAGIPLLLSSSLKAGLDINWSDPLAKDQAIETLAVQVTSLHQWIEKHQLAVDPSVKPYVDALVQVRNQDLETTSEGEVQIRRGVAADRRVSIEDAEMRHGRKSKSKRFNGYKEHIATDLDSELIVGCAVTPANRPEDEATPQLEEDLYRSKMMVGQLHIDRAYVNSTLAQTTLEQGGEVIAKPWAMRSAKAGVFTKTDFKINMRDRTVTCPAGHVERFEPGDIVEFDPEVCGPCPVRATCTMSASGRGRTIQISKDEQTQQRFRRQQASSKGRARLRARTGVEHRLAHVAARKGPRARYRGTRKNLYDLRRAATLQNLETIHRRQLLGPKAAR